MEDLKISTSQNVDIDHDLACIGDRMLAHLLDYCIFYGYFLVIFLLFSITFPGDMAVLIILLLPMVFYDLVFEYFFRGQSVGKMVARIKVVRLDGSPASFGNYLLRWLFRIVDNLLLTVAVSVVMITVTKKGQRIGDIAAGTTLIKLSRKVRLEDINYVRCPDNYIPIYTTVNSLSEQDIQTVKEVLNFYKVNKNKAKDSVFAENAKVALENKMNIKTQQLPIDFLKTVLMEFYHLNK